jgi:hypothetical protein
MRRVLNGFNTWKLWFSLVLQWCFYNKLVFEDFDGFSKLRGQWAIFDLLILRETWSALDKNLLRKFEAWTNENKSIVLHNRYHNYSWLSWPISKPRRSNSNFIVIKEYLKLVDGVYTFYLDPTLFNLEICRFTFICLNIPTRSAQNYL